MALANVDYLFPLPLQLTVLIANKTKKIAQLFDTPRLICVLHYFC